MDYNNSVKLIEEIKNKMMELKLWSIKDLSRYLRMPYHCIYAYMTYNRNIPLDKMLEICKKLKLDYNKYLDI